MKIFTMLFFITLLWATNIYAQNISFDKTDLAKAISKRDGNLIEVKNSEHLLGYLHAETNFACPQIVLVVYSKSGNYIDADAYTKRAFYTATRSEGLLSINHAYIIRTRFMVYFIDLRKGTSNH